MKSDKGVGVPNDYKKEAHDKFDVLWKVRLKGRKFLVDDIPLHCSLRVFDHLDEKAKAEVKKKIEEFGVTTPDSKDLSFKPIIFHSRHTHRDYYMLNIEGMHENCNKFFNHFKEGYGFSHPNFKAHITIDKELYDDINKEGLEPNEVEFDDLTIEAGAGNTIHHFEEMDKSEDKPYDSQRMLAAIAKVEESKGTNQNFQSTGMVYQGEAKFGKYGMMPGTIRETIQMNSDLMKKHGKVANLGGDDMRRYMTDNPELEHEVALKHLERLEHHFGKNPGKIGYAWLEGISKTYRADKNDKDIENHWQTKRIKDAYSKEK